MFSKYLVFDLLVTIIFTLQKLAYSKDFVKQKCNFGDVRSIGKQTG